MALGGDGQVTLGTSIMKGDAMKIRRLMDGKVITGFAGSTPTPSPCWSGSRPNSRISRQRSPCGHRVGQGMANRSGTAPPGSLLAVVDRQHTLLVTGNGDVIQPTDGVLGIGSGGNFAVAAARALVAHSDLSAADDGSPIVGNRGGHRHLYERQHRGGTNAMRDLTPRQIVAELDKHIIAQQEAKRAVAVAVRNRWRRQQLPEEMRGEIAPKNILMIGPTGVGKTEIARRLARLTGAPSSKSKPRNTPKSVITAATWKAWSASWSKTPSRWSNRRTKDGRGRSPPPGRGATARSLGPARCPLRHLERRARIGRASTADPAKARDRLAAGEMEDRKVEITLEKKTSPMMLAGLGMEQMDVDLQGMFEKMMPKSTSRREMTIAEARRVLVRAGVRGTDQSGKGECPGDRTGGESGHHLSRRDRQGRGRRGLRGQDVSRQGVQRDLLPIVEGTTVQTKYGYLKTDHILFIAAGAFHRTKPNDLMPELQGRFLSASNCRT